MLDRCDHLRASRLILIRRRLIRQPLRQVVNDLADIRALSFRRSLKDTRCPVSPSLRSTSELSLAKIQLAIVELEAKLKEAK